MNGEPHATSISRMVAWIVANPRSFAPVRDDPERRRCTECEVWKLLSEFTFEHGSPRKRCKRCAQRHKMAQRRLRARRKRK